ncbi:hypothetical protein [Mesobacillus jeotgali]|uniref:hypothetical protein n=1 Tax=Mesobacillus jeotgali TaxID=129985 RepID=UPI0009A5E7DF|nr:hypothetical protein [Mesobacillus jeotgali]
MPTISKIRFTNVVYEDGMKRYNDELFRFDGYNGAILLENGGGKTVFIQTALQAIMPHTSLAERKIKQTLQLDNYPAHIAIEWILSDSPRHYLLTCVSLFLTKNGLDSYRYVYEYKAGDKSGIEDLPFVRKDTNRPSDRGEISDYYSNMAHQNMNAHTFSTIKAFQNHIEDQYHIITDEWEAVVKINSTEGGVEAFFDECKQTNQLFDRLLIPTVEGAIAGHHANTFADTFEKHRASFKLYKELKEQIEENKAIEEQLNRYASTYERLFEQQQAYQRVKGRAKAVLEEISRQEQHALQELKGLVEKMTQWEQEENENKKKVFSLDLYKERLLLQTIEAEWKESEQQLHIVQENLSASKNQYHSLKLAQLKKEWKEASEKLAFHLEKLAELDEDEDIQDIQDRLEENSRELKGYFSQEIEASLKRTQDLKIERRPIEEALKQMERDRQKQENELEQVKGLLNQKIGTIDTLEAQLKRIRQRILSNPNQETVKESVPKWEQRLGLLDEQTVQLKTENKRIATFLLELEVQQERLNTEKSQKWEVYSKSKLEVDLADQDHDKVKVVLARLRPQWAQVDSLYLKQDSIVRQVRDQLEGLERERESSLFKERIAYRRIDDYGEQDLFFADPFLEKQIIKWTNQFSFLQTGVQFIQSLEESATESAAIYPLWPVTLVTTATDMSHLLSKVQSVQQQLQFPINVMTIEQASAIVQGENTESNVVAPAHWRENHSPDLFQKWKLTMMQYAEKAKKDRLEIEGQLERWKKADAQLIEFFQNYPYEEVQQQKSYVHELFQTLSQLDIQIRDNRATISENRELMKSQEDRVKVYSDEHNGLEGKLKDAREYLQLEKERNELLSHREKLVEQSGKSERQIKRYKEHEKRLKEELDLKEKDIWEETSYAKRQQADPLYAEVINVQPVYANKSRAVLQEARDELNFALRKLSGTRNEIELKISHTREELKRIEKGMEDARLEHADLDEEIIFPPNGTERISSLRLRIKDLEETVQQETKKYNSQNTLKIQQDKAVEIAQEKFATAFPQAEPIFFTKSAADIQEELQEEAIILEERKAFLQKEQTRLEGEINSLQQAFHQLDRFEEAHHFKGPTVKAAILEEDELQAFTYRRKDFVKGVTDQLTRMSNLVGAEKGKVEHAKETFKHFCKNNITNVKMREMARQGIDSKKTYGEVLEFQRHMQKRIQTAIKYNEATIIDHDKQLEQFVTHINSHLFTIAGELALIPKKTKVKVDDKWKEIFQFSIPAWTEEEGKSRIRKHIEWILGQLDSDRFLSSDGTEDYGKMRKEIETWIHSKQLLRIVMNNESMKVTCRKVTNDNQVTTRSYSWEQSNAWSGGEKWSKNMTLFLGILNYVTEKRKHSVAKTKRHRVVIMDNPFGKASSDHVLNPVFFIAEQLGFQIIALTAHAEGKFLRDYFPVIYSCRLRKAADSNKQIMTKIKQLHQAYFQDHEPQALERLGEVEQLELFS